MKIVTRLIGMTAIGGCALAFAGSAFAALNPTFLATATAGSSTVSLTAADSGLSDDATARIQMYVPAGFTFTAPAMGAKATASSSFIETTRDPNTALRTNGSMIAVSTTDAAVTQGTAGCDTGSHIAAWSATFTTSDGDTFTFPVVVDQTTGTETQFGAYKLVACFRPLGTGSSSSNTSGAGGLTPDTYGNKLVSATLNVPGFGVPTKSGSYLWRSLWTPYATGSGTLNTAGNVEAQSTTRIASTSLTLTGKLKKVGNKTQVTLTGKLMFDGAGVADVLVALHHGATKTKLVSLGSAKTVAGGTFSRASALTKATYFQAGATVQKSDLGAGGCTASFGVTCADATVGAEKVLSNVLHFAAPKK